MDRKKFVKSMSLLGGFVLSGTTFAEALERQESGRKPRYGNHEKSGWEVIVIGGGDRKSTRLNSSHMPKSRMPSSA